MSYNRHNAMLVGASARSRRIAYVRGPGWLRLHTRENTRARIVICTSGEDATERLYPAKHALNALDM